MGKGIIRTILDDHRDVVMYKRLFYRFSTAFHPVRRSSEAPCPLVAHFELLPQISDVHVRQALSDHKALLRAIGYQLQETEWQSKMPPEYIGILSCYHGEILEYREYLKTQVVHYEKKHLVSQRID